LKVDEEIHSKFNKEEILHKNIQVLSITLESQMIK